MSEFRAAVEDQRLVLEHVAAISELPGVDIDMIDAVLEGVGQFAKGQWAPLDRIGDTVGARYHAGQVTMPAGYREAYREYVDGGWGTIGAPQEFGGQGLPISLASAVIETLGTANTGFALAPVLTSGAVEALLHHGSAEQKAIFLPKMVTGEWTGTMNLTESQAGSDVGALRARAEPRGDGRWLIRGTKIFISFGDHDLTDNIVHLVLARTPGAPEGTKGISLFLVPKYRLDGDGGPGEPNGVETVSIEHKMGLHASPTCVLAFGEGAECIGELVGEEGDGMRCMFTMMNNARLNVALQAVQVAERATQRAAAYAADRIQGRRNGKQVPIREHPDVRRMLLRMQTQTQAARALVYSAFGEIDRAKADNSDAQSRADLLTPLAKAHATDIGMEVTSLGIQVHGGMGYIEETGAAQHFRDARIFPIYEGTNGIQAADLVGRKLVGDGGQALEALFCDIEAETSSGQLMHLVAACRRVMQSFLTSETDDRLAGSYAFTTMASVAVCGWLLERLGKIPSADGSTSTRSRRLSEFYLATIVGEAAGLEGSALVGAAILYAPEAEFAG